MTEKMLALSPEIKDEVGGDQLSNEQSGWSSPEWVADEE